MQKFDSFFLNPAAILFAGVGILMIVSGAAKYIAQESVSYEATTEKSSGLISVESREVLVRSPQTQIFWGVTFVFASLLIFLAARKGRLKPFAVGLFLASFGLSFVASNFNSTTYFIGWVFLAAGLFAVLGSIVNLFSRKKGREN